MTIYSNNNGSSKAGSNGAASYVNFDELASRARTSNKAEDLNALYKAFLTLEDWYFVTKSKADVENAKPFIGFIDEQPWLYIFTDSEKAHAFSKNTPGFLKEDGSSYFIKMKVVKALKMTFQLGENGVYGIRVNEGENGWYCPIAALPQIMAHLGIKLKS